MNFVPGLFYKMTKFMCKNEFFSKFRDENETHVQFRDENNILTNYLFILEREKIIKRQNGEKNNESDIVDVKNMFVRIKKVFQMRAHLTKILGRLMRMLTKHFYVGTVHQQFLMGKSKVQYVRYCLFGTLPKFLSCGYLIPSNKRR